MAIVKNINGTSDNTCLCGSWINHWRKYTQKLPVFCSVNSCNDTDLVGAHVQKDSNDMSWYIVPLCKSHNKSATPLDIGNSTLVSANRRETCGKI